MARIAWGVVVLQGAGQRVAGVGDHRVQPAPPVDDLTHGQRDVVLVGGVTGDRQQLLPGVDGGGEGIQAAGIATGDRHQVTLLEQRPGRGRTDAARTAGYQRDAFHGA
ncbi:hypothetical protein GCM10020000_84270 [Streptomyces olivoverticillatus]